MQNFNPFICVLDPALHTFQYVRERSPFLFTVMLAASAKAFNPALHSGLHKYSEHLLTRAFAEGAKSPEVIQAIVFSTYWKELDDTRSWSLIGYVIRLCMELGWHKLMLKSDENDSTVSELEVRQRRNIERTWFILFVYERGFVEPWGSRAHPTSDCVC